MGKDQLIDPAMRDGIAGAPRNWGRIEDRMDPHYRAMRIKKAQSAPLEARFNWPARAEYSSSLVDPASTLKLRQLKSQCQRRLALPFDRVQYRPVTLAGSTHSSIRSGVCIGPEPDGREIRPLNKLKFLRIVLDCQANVAVRLRQAADGLGLVHPGLEHH